MYMEVFVYLGQLHLTIFARKQTIAKVSIVPRWCSRSWRQWSSKK